MARVLLLLLFTLQSTAFSPSSLAAGSEEESLFFQVWTNLGKILEPLAYESEVTEALRIREAVREARIDAFLDTDYLLNARNGTLTISPAILTRTDGQPRTRAEMVSLVLDILLGCQSGLVGANTKDLAEHALSFLLFEKIIGPDGMPWRFWHRRVGGRDFLQMGHLGHIENLKQLFLNRMRLTEQDVQFNQVRVLQRADSVILTGHVDLYGQRPGSYGFSLRLWPPHEGGRLRAELIIH